MGKEEDSEFEKRGEAFEFLWKKEKA